MTRTSAPRPALCFDATGTLIELTASVGEVYAEVAREHGIELPAWRLDDAFRRVMRHPLPNTPVSPAPIDDAGQRQADRDLWSERIRQTFQATDSTVRFEDFGAFAETLFETFREARRWRSRPGVALTLARLHAEGDAMAVVSNFDHRLPDILEGLELTHYFESIEIPSPTARPKPARDLFERARTRLRRPLEELLYVGDDDPSVLEAIAAHGIRTVDVRALESFDCLPEWIASPATLPAT